MDPVAYVSGVEGVRFLRTEHVPVVVPQWHLQANHLFETTRDFSERSAREILSRLPIGLEFSCYDASCKQGSEPVYTLVRRIGVAELIRRKAGEHGIIDRERIPLEAAARLLWANPYVNSPGPDPGSFSIS